LFNNAVGYYNNVKNSSTLATRSLSLCESVAKRGLEVSIPVIKKVDEYTHIDQRSAALLGAIEERAVTAKENFDRVNTMAHQPLDTIIDVLDKYLPLHAQGADQAPEEGAVAKNPKELSSVAKVRAIGTHIGQAGVEKLRVLQLRGPVHQQVAGQLWEVVNFSVATIKHVPEDINHAVQSTSTYVAGKQHELFLQAASAASVTQKYIEKSPLLLAIERALEPYALASKSAAERAATRILAHLHVGSDLVTAFFANKLLSVQEVAQQSAKTANELVQRVLDNERLQGLLTTLHASFASVSSQIETVAALPLDQLQNALTILVSVLQTVHARVQDFSEQLKESAKQNSIISDKLSHGVLLVGSVPSEHFAEHHSEDAAVASSSSSSFQKKKKGKKH
jgi:hypothetical protein